jgi:hypothetical protein
MSRGAGVSRARGPKKEPAKFGIGTNFGATHLYSSQNFRPKTYFWELSYVFPRKFEVGRRIFCCATCGSRARGGFNSPDAGTPPASSAAQNFWHLPQSAKLDMKFRIFT